MTKKFLRRRSNGFSGDNENFMQCGRLKCSFSPNGRSGEEITADVCHVTVEARIIRSVKDAKRRVAIEMLEIKGFPQYGLNYVASLSR